MHDDAHMTGTAMAGPDPGARAGRTRLPVVILGGGWSGAAVAFHLLRQGQEGLEVVIVESRERVGTGVAYGTVDARLLLNVPAGRMSLDPECPRDFLDWARATYGDVSEHSFVPRAWVGRYVSECLTRAVREGRPQLRIVRDEAVSVRRVRGGWQVGLASGACLDAHGVVLATGHGPPRVPEPLTHLRDDARLVTDPLAPGGLQGVDIDSRVLVVGTGLTALDALHVLRESGHRGPVHAVSRSGAWPLPHRPDGEATLPRWPLQVTGAPHTADALAAWFAAEMDAARAADVPWQAVLVAVRPHIATLWSRMPLAEQARFLAMYRSRWEVLRHRAPYERWRAMRAWHDDGWIRTFAGGVCAADATPEGLRVVVGGETHVYGRVILCTGAETDVRRFPGLLWRQLLEDGIVTRDPLGLGIHTTASHAVIGAQGPHPDAWAVGGLQRPRVYESTSVPDLSVQASAISRAAIARVGTAGTVI
jgi:uncharacterized NAD(P)/FAD-binding protein YdhS